MNILGVGISRYFMFAIGMFAASACGRAQGSLIFEDACDSLALNDRISVSFSSIGIHKDIKILDVTCAFDWASPNYRSTPGKQNSDSISFRCNLSNTGNQKGRFRVTTLEDQKEYTYHLSINYYKSDSTDTLTEVCIYPDGTKYLRNLQPVKEQFAFEEPISIKGAGIVKVDGPACCVPHYRIQYKSTSGAWKNISPWNSDILFIETPQWHYIESDALELHIREFHLLLQTHHILEKDLDVKDNAGTFKIMILGPDNKFYDSTAFSVMCFQ